MYHSHVAGMHMWGGGGPMYAFQEASHAPTPKFLNKAGPNNNARFIRIYVCTKYMCSDRFARRTGLQCVYINHTIGLRRTSYLTIYYYIYERRSVVSCEADMLLFS